MTVRPIRYLGDPVLRQPAKKVRHVDDSIRRLIVDMIESMYAAQGVGLAAGAVLLPMPLGILWHLSERLLGHVPNLQA